MLKAVIFDMDGVIIDSEPFHLEVNRQLYKELNIPFIEEEYAKYIGVSNEEMWRDIKEKNNLPQTVSHLKKLQISRDMEYMQNINGAPIAGVSELLIELQEAAIPIALASSSSMQYIGIVLDSFNLRSFFTEIVSGENIEHGKPAPDIFLHTAKLLNMPPESCAVIEDSKNGVLAAKAAGMQCIGFKNPNSGNQDISTADLITDNLTKINLETLKKLYKNH